MAVWNVAGLSLWEAVYIFVLPFCACVGLCMLTFVVLFVEDDDVPDEQAS